MVLLLYQDTGPLWYLKVMAKKPQNISLDLGVEGEHTSTSRKMWINNLKTQFRTKEKFENWKTVCGDPI